ncbi:winged helix-turn-helix domain-containing protein [Streptomyces sp. NPDC049687]|uniref:response regulator transcription factor n=1 Tax=Streptomyces sp. NPDC049687 TaxID=3365596 RepID=UPI0037AACCE2
MGVRVLLIEDDQTIAEPLVEGLGHFGLTVHHVGTGNEGLRGPYGDVVLLDLGLPDVDGIDVCRGIRQASDVPIIILSARGEEADRVLGLELGADDYLAKPFSMRELVARVRAVTRRTQRGAAGAEPAGGESFAAPASSFEPVYSPPAPASPPAEAPVGAAGPLVVDRRTRQVWVGEEAVTLTPKEFELLALLTEDPGAVYSRQQILDRVWDPHYEGPTKTLDVHVATLRRKLGNPAWIQTLRGVGFRLAVHSQPPAAPQPPAPQPQPAAHESQQYRSTGYQDPPAYERPAYEESGYQQSAYAQPTYERPPYDHPFTRPVPTPHPSAAY